MDSFHLAESLGCFVNEGFPPVSFAQRPSSLLFVLSRNLETFEISDDQINFAYLHTRSCSMLQSQQQKLSCRTFSRLSYCLFSGSIAPGEGVSRSLRKEGLC